MRTFSKRETGGSLVEVILAIALFAIIAPALVIMALSTHSASLRSEKSLEATAFAQEGLEAARSIRDFSWNNLTVGTHGFNEAGGFWELLGTSDTRGGYTRSLTVSEVNSYTKEARVDVNWEVLDGLANTTSMVTRFTDWKLLQWIQTLVADFQAGSRNSVNVEGTQGGEVTLSPLGIWSTASLVASYNFSGDADINGMAMLGGILYVATKNEGSGREFIGLDMSDISNGNISVHGGAALNTHANKIAIANGYAYVSTDDNAQEVMVIRLSDYTKVNSINFPGTADADGIAVLGNTLVVGRKESSEAEFLAFDISDPEGNIGPALFSLEIGDRVEDIAIDSGYAYAVSQHAEREVIIIRLADGTVTQNIDLPGDADGRAVFIAGTRAYIGRNESSAQEFVVLDISVPEGGVNILGGIDIGGNIRIRDLFISGNFAYAATGYSNPEVYVFDIANMTVEAVIDIPGNLSGYAIWFSGAYIYVGSTDNVETLNVFRGGEGGWLAPRMIDSFDTTGSLNAYDVFVSGSFAYVVTADNTGGPEFYILNVSMPSSVTLAGTYEIGGDVRAVAVSGNYAYLATNLDTKELLVLDISNPANPIEVANYNTAGDVNARAISFSGNILALGTANNSGGSGRELYFFNISSPFSPALLGSYEISESVEGIALSGNYAYVATNHSARELDVIDFSDPANPAQAAQFDIPGGHEANNLAFFGGRVYFVTDNASNNGDFYILDVSNLSAISVMSFLNLARHNFDVSLSADGTLAFITTGQDDEELTILDVADPTAPSVFSTFDAGNDGRGIFFGDYVYLATNNDTMEFQLIGPSTANSGFSREGIFTSSAFNATSTSASYGTISWTLSGSGSLQFQIRTADTEANLAQARFIGPDGTGNTYYTISGSSIAVDPSASGTQWIQYQTLLKGDGSGSPLAEVITITYEL